MDVLLSEKIESLVEKKRQTIISICGAADLGKSYLSREVVKKLSIKGISANHLTLDSFLIERSIRLQLGISGYQIEAYEQKLALEALSQFKQGKSIYYYPYNHDAGKRGPKLEILKPSSVLIFDGVQSMHKSFLFYSDFSVFIYTEDDNLKRIRYEADLTKRNYTTDFAKDNSEPEFIQYKTEIEPYKTQADFRLYLQKKWTYFLQK